MATHGLPRLTEEEYLALDRASPFRSEYVEGEMLAMAGGSLRHSALAVRCGIELNAKLVGRGCTVFSSDARIRTPGSGSYVYPDVSVVCGAIQTHQKTVDVLINPILVVEVLPSSTQKFDLYREIPSLREYLLVSSDSAKAGHFSRQTDNSWLFRETCGMEAGVFIPALSITVDLSQIYKDVLSIPG